ncbi:LuxR C-terminal-related transcriptional regulator [Azospirillum halopraeferens]|uniref:LuxR C-terminal-related transcriptional regulator n=1 Tax=Azospirillum halopraeferens TaxID=34010 RepID=UPI00041819B3|nr:response regulator transcription factor [Azospirillum halopraeferens]
MPTPWDTMLVDHDRLFSAALGALIANGPFSIGHYAATADEALAAIAAGAAPDLIVLAAPAAAGDEPAGLRRLRAACDARIAVLADTLSDRPLSRALEAGADAYLDKAMSSESLLRALQLVMLGEVVYPTHVASLLMATTNERPVAPVLPALSGNELSRREVQILRCLLAGQSNKAIARHLHITESTVKMHFKNVMRKINAQNRTQAAVWAIQNGLSPLMSA